MTPVTLSKQSFLQFQKKGATSELEGSTGLIFAPSISSSLTAGPGD